MNTPAATTHHYRAWRKLNVGLLRTTPLWGRAAMGVGLRYGQTYGTPLTFGLIEETGEGYFGEKAHKWWQNPNGRIEPEPTHPDSPVFRDTPPQP